MNPGLFFVLSIGVNTVIIYYLIKYYYQPEKLAGPQGIQGRQGITGTQGTEGSGGGSSVAYNNQVRYNVFSSAGNVELDLMSTGNYMGGASWVRSGTSITVTSDGHGFSNGDIAYLRGMGDNNNAYGAVSSVTANTFVVDDNVINSGATSSSVVFP